MDKLMLRLGANRVWRTYPGGFFLDTLENRPDPQDDHFPEDWIASTTRAVNIGREALIEGLSRVSWNGHERTLKEVLEDPGQAAAFLGGEHVAKYGPDPHFLVKFLDSALRLHVQAHPNRDFAEKHLGSRAGKTEAYYILGTRDKEAEPVIYLGFKKRADRKDFKALVEKQDIEGILSHLHKIRVKPGDSFYVPGACPHAIGAGIFMVEIMEPTDFAVRFEFERAGYVLPEAARFMDRGIDFALDMLDFDPVGEQKLKDRLFSKPLALPGSSGAFRAESLIDGRHTDCFSLRRYEVAGHGEIREDSFGVLIVLSGRGYLGGNAVKPYDRFFVSLGAAEALLAEPEDTISFLFIKPPL